MSFETDPVCGMTVDPSRAVATVKHEGQTYHFCGKGCAAKFVADPVKYLAKSASAQDQPQAPPAAGTQYTCPMDPQIVRDRPGACPICGMAL